MFNTNTDKILSVFTKTVDKLEKHIRMQDVDIDTFTTVRDLAHAKIVAAQAEQEKARAAAKKLREFFGGPTD